MSLRDTIIESLFCILWEIFGENWRKESRERSLWKRGELGHEGTLYCNSRRKGIVHGDGVRRESLAYNTGCTLFWISESFSTISASPYGRRLGRTALLIDERAKYSLIYRKFRLELLLNSSSLCYLMSFVSVQVI